MSKFKIYLIGVVLPVLLLGIIAFFALYWNNRMALGAPAVFISTPATTSPTALRNFSFTIGTSTPQGPFGSSTLAVYGSTTIQTWMNTTHALEVFNSATSSVFSVDTLNNRTNVTSLVISGTCTGCSSSAFVYDAWTHPAAGQSATTSLMVFNGGFTATLSTTTQATTTQFAISGITSSLIVTGSSGQALSYGGTSCTNQFIRSLSALGAATCATVGSADVSLANLTATDGTLTFSGTYNGSTARTIGLNLGQANIWTALQTFYSAGLVAGSSTFTGVINASSTLTLSPPSGTTLLNTSTSTGGAWIIDSYGRLSFATSSPPTHALVIAKGSAFADEMPLIDGAVIDVDFRAANQGRVTLAGNRAMKLQGGYPGQTYRLFVSQDGTGSRKMTGWTSAETWPIYFVSASLTATTTPEASLKANVVCLISFIVTKGTSTPMYIGTLESCTY